MKLVIFIFLIILILLLFKYYWKLQIIYNSSILSFKTPSSIFPLSRERERDFEKRVTNGKRIAKKTKIVICALLRDASHKLDKIIERAEKVASLFGDYRILIVENDSIDDTRKNLLKWSEENPRVKILGCGINRDKCSLKTDPTVGHSITFKRIKKMALLRNIYLSHVYKNYSDFDLMIVWDLDIIGNVYLDGILNSISYFHGNSEINTICANGIYRWGPLSIFYDTYALLRKNQEFHISTKLFHDIKEGLTFNYSRDSELVEVDSCFSGFTIYKLSSVLELYHDIPHETDNNLYCEHVTLNKKIGTGIFVNPKMIYILLLNE